MFLDTWMIIVALAAFGFCAVYNRGKGFREGRDNGIMYTINTLYKAKIIEYSKEKNLYVPYGSLNKNEN
jgi:hypothetical protein